jgi:hypothetical protein
VGQRAVALDSAGIILPIGTDHLLSRVRGWWHVHQSDDAFRRNLVFKILLRARGSDAKEGNRERRKKEKSE